MARLLYRVYRRLKRAMLEYRPPVLTYCFFAALAQIDRLMSPRRMNRWDELAAQVERSLYFARYSRQSPPFVLHSQKRVAVDSDDHRRPRGTVNDNSSNRRFNLKLYDWLEYKRDLAVLDLGCSGGAFVKSVLNDGYTAIGLEGSDVSQKLGSGEWSAIPLHLFTCDITSPFRLERADGTKMLFDVVTCWEVLEHIPKEKIPVLIRNISDNLRDGGLLIASVDTAPDGNPNLNAVYHLTLEGKAWWLGQFASLGFVSVQQHPFVTRDWVRGNGTGLKDWDPADGEGFHLVMRKTGESVGGSPGETGKASLA